MKNPLNRRFKRELKEEFGKYLVLFLFLGGMIAFVSGFLVANDSMTAAYNESFDTYNIEDGNFELEDRISEHAVEAIEKEGVMLYSNTYVEESTKEADSTLRIFQMRTEVNKACLMDGAFPERTDEIAIDRMYADNNDFQVGDQITLGRLSENYRIES